MTGRENIFLNGAILGMRRAEIARKFDEIVAFAEVEEFIDTPVKRYSTGMYTRLAFAVAAHIDSEIMIIDEVLAVGDIEFQKKCLGKMDALAKKAGRTVLFVSHHMPSIASLCTRAIRLTKGQIVDDGPPSAVIKAYIRDNSQSGTEVTYLARKGEPTITRVAIDHGRLAEGEICIEVGFEAEREFVPHPGIIITSPAGDPLFGTNTRCNTAGYATHRAKTGTVRLTIPKLPLVADSYGVTVYLGDEFRDFDVRENALRFFLPGETEHQKRPPSPIIGYLDISSTWSRV
jgi:lipopolysaccharide transport system ATP-binding protein